MHAGFGDILEIHGYVPKIANNQMSEIQLLKVERNSFPRKRGRPKRKKNVVWGSGVGSLEEYMGETGK